MPRLNRTLKRKPQFRDLIDEDLKYLWVIYKKGDLALPDNLSPTDFDEVAINTLLNIYDFGWTFLRDGKPIGFAFATLVGPILFMGDAIWINASSRNKAEHAVNLFNTLRKEKKILFYSAPRWKDFYLYIAKHGILRRVGQINDLGEQMTLWESR